MLSYLSGKVIQVSPHRVIVEVHGLGFWLYTPLSVSKNLTPGQLCTFLTVLELPREEGEPVLYGFLHEEERKLFGLLRKVPRLGPQKALALLSRYSPEQLIQIIHAREVKALSSVKGIGPKLAQQILLDLQSALKSWPKPTLPPAYQEAYEALLSLGYTPAEAQTRLQKALQQHPDAPAEELVRLALKFS